MAGPCASVFLEKLDEPVESWLRRTVSEISSKVDGWDFWVTDSRPIGGGYQGEERPFFWYVQPTSLSEGEYSAHELATVAASFGLHSRVSVGICALANDECDHRILARIALALLDEAGGVVDFHDLLLPPRKGDGYRAFLALPAAERAARFLAAVGDGSGRLEAVSFDPGEPPSRHFGDAAFLKHWLSHPSFRMVCL